MFITKNLSPDSTIVNGTEITSINNVSAAKLIDSLNSYITADGYNTTYKKHLMNNAGMFAERYRFLYPEKEPLDISLKSSSGSRQIKLVAHQQKGYDSSGVNLPKAEYKILTADSNIAYLKLRTFYNGPDYVGYQGIFEDIEKRKFKTLIIDLRGNTGGELIWAARVYSHLLDFPRYFFKLPEEIKKQKRLYNDQKIRNWLNKVPRSNYQMITPYSYTFKGKIYVLIDGGSFSSSSILAANLKNLKNVTLVGEETGGSKNIFTAGVHNSITLPVSQLAMRYGNVPAFFGDITNIDGRGVMPDVTITYQIEDHLAGKDLELDWVFQDIKNNGFNN